MIEDNSDPGEIDPEELRRKLADMGAPLTPNIVNADNAWLDPIVGCIGHVSEVNGAEAEEVLGFVPTRHELSVLVKHWMTEVIDYEFEWFRWQQTSSSGSRRAAFGSRRISRIAAFIGDDAVQRAVDEAYDQFGRKHESEGGRIFRHGTEEERREFRAMCDAEAAAIHREYEEQFYANLLKFVAGEPHDIKTGTVGMEWAEIAKALIVENPVLAAPESKDMLLGLMRDRSLSGHTVHLDESHTAAVKALVHKRFDRQSAD
jgi:hypothetical protein